MVAFVVQMLVNVLIITLIAWKARRLFKLGARIVKAVREWNVVKAK